jgi:ABC-type amino acid transport substrate-binding protein
VVEPTQAPAEEAPAEAPTTAPAEEAAPAAPTSGLNVAVNANFRPFLFTDENGNLAGFDIDIMNALSAAANFEVGYEDRSFDGMLDALAAGEYDAAMSAITINDTRKEKVDFTCAVMTPTS